MLWWILSNEEKEISMSRHILKTRYGATKRKNSHSDVQDINHCNRVLAGPGAGTRHIDNWSDTSDTNSGKIGFNK